MNKKINLEITDYGYSGEGVGRDKGKVCFVHYALKDELVEGEILKENKNFVKLRLTQIKRPSDLRVKASCPYFSKCGGCAFQNLKYENELEVKKYMIQNQIRKTNFDGEIEVCKSYKEYGYRNKIKLFCNETSLCLNTISSNKLVPIDRCLLVEEEINNAINSVQTFINAKNIESSVENVYIRRQGEITLVWFKYKQPVKVEYSGLQIMLGADCGIFVSTGSEKPTHIIGKSSLKATEFGLNCDFEVNAFHQVNDYIGEKLYEEVAESVLGNKVINAYSGAGVLSGILAKKGKTVYGIELGQAEHESAEKLKETNNLVKLFNIKGDCSSYIPQLISSDLQTLIIDPPRAGCDQAVTDAINNSNIKRVVYVSCESSTLVRDVNRLTNYKVKKVKIFDMFPKTSSIELLCILERK